MRALVAAAFVLSPARARAAQDRHDDQADVAITLGYGGEPAAVYSGDTIVYVISAHNYGGNTARNVRIRQELPAGIFVGATGGGILSGGGVDWPVIERFAAGTTLTFEVRLLVGACPATLTSEATITSTAPRDPDLSNNHDSVNTPVVCRPAPQPDVEVIKSGPQGAGVGDTIVYRITVRNVGTSTASFVGLSDVLPSSGTLAGSTSGATLSGGTLVWPAMELLSGEAREFEVRWLAPACPVTLLNTALVSAAGDANQTNDRSTVITRVDGPSCPPPEADVRIDKSGPERISIAQETVRYDILVTNGGPSAATDLVVTDTLPVGATIERVEPAPASTRAVGDSVLVVTWLLDRLEATSSAPPFSLTIRRRAASFPIINVAAVRSGSPRDPDLRNNVDTVTTTVFTPVADVALSKQLLDSLRVGATARFRFVLSNHGPDVALPPDTVTDVLPDGLTFVSGSGSGWSITAAGQTVTGVYSDTLGPGQTTSFDITVSVGAAALGGVCNTAVVRNPRVAPSANDSSTICAPVGNNVHLDLHKSSSRPDAVVGDRVDYTLAVRATGTGVLTDVHVVDLLPAGFRYVAGTARIGAVRIDPTRAGGALDFSMGQLTPPDSVIIRYTTRVDASAPQGDAVNRAVAGGGGESSDTATATVRVRAGDFSDRGLIIGRVFADAILPSSRAECPCAGNGDGVQSGGEQGVPLVRLFLQDGSSAVTDRDGMFSFPGLSPRTWIVIVDPLTLPPGARLESLTNRHSNDGARLFVDLKAGEMHRADFAVAADPIIRDSVAARRARSDSAATRRELDGFKEGTLRAAGVPLTVYRPLAAPMVSVRRSPFDLTRPFAGRAPFGAGDRPAEPTPAGSSNEEPSTPGGSLRPAGFRAALVSGLLEARLDRRSVAAGDSAGLSNDRFEDALRSVASRSDDGKRSAGARAALLFDGTLGSGYNFRFRFDTEEDDRAVLFRDIQPDAGYPIRGDASVQDFGAQSRSRIFGRIGRGASYLLYGDFNTAPGLGSGGSRSLGLWSRSLNGMLEHYETGRAAVTAWASRDRSSQVVDVIRGLGISGPYQLSRSDGLVNSERVEMVTRDRSQPAVIIAREVLGRFVDYTIEPFTGRLLFRRPVPSVDPDLNPVEIRVSYEVGVAGDRFWTAGGDVLLKPIDRLEVGGAIVRDDNPASTFDLASINATLDLGHGTLLTGEVARTDSAGSRTGDATRLELSHAWARTVARAWFLDSDTSFANPSAPWGRGRREVGLTGAIRIDSASSFLAEAIRTEDLASGGHRSGARLALDRRLSEWLSARIGYRYASGTSAPALPLAADTAGATSALGARLTLTPPSFERGSVFTEFEQDVTHGDRRRAALGADFRLTSGVRLYALHEFLRSLSGPYGLTEGQERNSTVAGLAAGARTGPSVFSEYRVRDAIGGREAQAAIGLRNTWEIRPGTSLSSSLERLAPLGSSGTSATAVTGGIELTGSPDWKGSARAEYRESSGSDDLFGSVGFLRRLNADLSFLATSSFSAAMDGDRAFEHTRAGLAYRPASSTRWNALARYEHRYDRQTVAGDRTTVAAHLLGATFDFRPSSDLLLRGQWLSRFGHTDAGGISTNDNAHQISARATADLTRRLDAGIIGRALFSGGDDARYGAGAELGVRLADGLRLAGGYNVFGYRAGPGGDRTDRGFYAQLDFAFDNRLFAGRSSTARCGCPVPPARRDRAVTPGRDSADVTVALRGPRQVHPGETATFWLVPANLGAALADSVRVILLYSPRESRRRIGSGELRSGSLEDTVWIGQLTRGAPPDWLRVDVVAPDAAEPITISSRILTSTPESDNKNNDFTASAEVLGPGLPDLDVVLWVPTKVLGDSTFAPRIVIHNRGGSAADTAVMTASLSGSSRFEGEDTSTVHVDSVFAKIPSGKRGLVKSTRIWAGAHFRPELPSVRAVSPPDSIVTIASVRSVTPESNTANNQTELVTRIEKPVPCVTDKPCLPDLSISLFLPSEFQPDDTAGISIVTRNLRGEWPDSFTVKLTVWMESSGLGEDGDGATVKDTTYIWPRHRPEEANAADVIHHVIKVGNEITAVDMFGEVSTEPLGMQEYTLENNVDSAGRPVRCKVSCSLDVALSIGGPDTVTVGDVVVDTLSIENRGATIRYVMVNGVAQGGAILPATGVNGPGLDWRFASMRTGEHHEQSIRIACTGEAVELTATVPVSNDARPDDNHAARKTWCARSDLAVDVEPSADSVSTGDPIAFKVTVSNRARGVARNADVQVRLPATVAGSSVEAEGGTIDGLVVIWPAIDSIMRDSGRTFRLSFTAPSTEGDLTVRAEAGTQTLESTYANNRGSSTVAVGGRGPIIDRPNPPELDWPIPPPPEPIWLIPITPIPIPPIHIGPNPIPPNPIPPDISWPIPNPPTPILIPPIRIPPIVIPPIPIRPVAAELVVDIRPNYPVVGHRVTYVIATRNTTADTIHNVVVVTTRPGRVRLDSASASAGADSVLRLPRIPSLAPDSVHLDTIVVIMPPATDTVELTARASVEPADTITSNLDSTMAVIQEVFILDRIPVPLLRTLLWLLLLIILILIIRIVFELFQLPWPPWRPHPDPLPSAPPAPPPPGPPSCWPAAACGLVRESDDAGCTAWLVEPDLCVTTAHAIQRRGVGGEVKVQIRGREVRARIEKLDSAQDIATLRLDKALHDVAPLELSDTLPEGVEWTGYGFNSIDPASGAESGGVVIRSGVTDWYGEKVMTLTAPDCAGSMLEPGNAIPGSPVLVGDKVIGQIRELVPHPDTLARTFSTLVRAVPADRIRELLGRDAPGEDAADGDEHSDASNADDDAAPNAGTSPDNEEAGTKQSDSKPDRDDSSDEKEDDKEDEKDADRLDGWLCHHPADRSRAEAVADLLEGRGIRLHMAERETLDAATRLPETEVEDLRKSRLGVLVYGPHWASSAPDVSAVLSQVGGDGTFHLIVARLDEAELPPSLRGFDSVPCPSSGSAGDDAWDGILARLRGEDASQSAVSHGIRQVTSDVLSYLMDAVGQPKRLRFIAKRWRETGLPGHQPLLFAADLLLNAGRPDYACEALADLPSGNRVDTLLSKALSLTGSIGKAKKLAENVAHLIDERPVPSPTAGQPKPEPGRDTGEGGAPGVITFRGRRVENGKATGAAGSTAGRSAAGSTGPTSDGIADMRQGFQATADAEADLRRRMEEKIAANPAGLGFCTLFTIEELVFAECMVEHERRLEIILPVPHDDFVSLYIPVDLVGRCERLLTDPHCRVFWLRDDLPASLDYTLVTECDAKVIERADQARDGQARKSGAQSADSAGPQMRGVGYRGPVEPIGEVEKYSRRFLLSIGVGDYAHLRQLKNAVNDAQKFAELLERDFGFDTRDTRQLMDGEATRERIEAEIGEMQKEVGAEDLFVLYFAGHGHIERGEGDAEHGYLVPVESGSESTEGMIPMEEVVSWTEKLASNNVIFILDSCHSGSAAIAGGETRRGGPRDARIVIASGSAEQPVLDGGGPKGQEKHSVFTAFLLDGLKGKLTASGAGVDDMSLFVYLRQTVEQATKRHQTPVYGPLPGHGTGRVEFRRTVAAPE